MNKIGLKITASIAILIGVISFVTGSRVLIGSFDPGNTTFRVLIYYNVIMGLISILAGYLIWKNHKNALSLSCFITIGHLVVLLLLKIVFNDVIAQESVMAMLFRSSIWVVIATSVLLLKRSIIKSYKERGL